MTFKTASAFRKALVKDIEDMKADLKKFDRLEKDTNKVFEAVQCRSAKKCYEADSTFYVMLDDFKGVNSKAKFKDKVVPVLAEYGFKSVSGVFETPNQIGVFAKIAGVNVVVGLNQRQGVPVLYVEVSEKNESGKTRQKLFG